MHTPPILLPDAHSFSELFEYAGEWDHAAPRDPITNAQHQGVEPRYIGQERNMAALASTVGIRTAMPPGNEIGPFCSIDLRQLNDYDGPAHRSIAVRATDRVIAALEGRIVTDDDHLSFRIIGHAGTKRCLVVCQHGQISGSHWLAYVDTASLPAYPYGERDARIAEIVREITDATDWVPYKRDLGAGAVEYGYDGIQTAPGKVQRPPRPVMIARISAAGDVERLGELPVRA